MMSDDRYGGWKHYEAFIYNYVIRLFPNGVITPNAKIQGTLSGVERQIDVLVELGEPDFEKIVVECKCYSRNINVKLIDGFSGFLRDVGVSQGIVITQTGVSPGAQNRAEKDNLDITIATIPLPELQDPNGFGGVVYRESHGALITPPDGWVINPTRVGGVLAWLHPYGLSLDRALQTRQACYLDIYEVDAGDPKPVETLISSHNTETESRYQTIGNVEFTRLPPFKSKRGGVEATIQRVVIPDYGGVEYGAYVHFDDFILYFSLHTHHDSEDEYLRKLKQAVEKTFPMSFQRATGAFDLGAIIDAIGESTGDKTDD